MKACTVCQAKHTCKSQKCTACKQAFQPKPRKDSSSKPGYIVKQDGFLFVVMYKDNAPSALDPTPQLKSIHEREQDAEAEARRLLGLVDEEETRAGAYTTRRGGNRANAAASIGKLLKANTVAAGECRPRLQGVKP